MTVMIIHVVMGVDLVNRHDSDDYTVRIIHVVMGVDLVNRHDSEDYTCSNGC